MPVTAKLIVNEVMSNEPAGYTGLEWFELYNDGAGTLNLSFYQITAGGTQIVLSDSIQPNSYLVICRKLVGIPASPGFETHWGNNSGLWGDTPQENFRVLEVSFALTNTTGAVSVTFLGNPESDLTWSSAGGDGISWEREGPTSLVIGQSIAPSGSTPGTVNSLAPMARDLSLDSIDVTWQAGVTTLTFIVTSRSSSTVTGASLLLYIVDPADSTNTANQLETVPLPAVDTGFTTAVVRELTLAGTYVRIGGLLSTDDRTYNNRRIRTVPGQQFPPVILSEFLPNPEGSLTTEWIELYNREDTAVSLAGWRIGDSTGVSSPFPALALSAHEYLIVAEDSLAFRQFYQAFTGNLATVTGWPTLNNSADLVRLIDSFSLEADRFAYVESYSENVTWGKSLADGRWGRSAQAGGTPGDVNDLRFAPDASALKVELSPRIFSPDNDGVEDSVVIRIEAPEADGYTVRIYNSDGRLVKTFENKSRDLAGEYSWDGRDDAGGRLTVGIYILFVEAVGVESVKKTLVVAR
jgi:hypothetical protein